MSYTDAGQSAASAQAHLSYSFSLSLGREAWLKEGDIHYRRESYECYNGSQSWHSLGKSSGATCGRGKRTSDQYDRLNLVYEVYGVHHEGSGERRNRQHANGAIRLLHDVLVRKDEYDSYALEEGASATIKLVLDALHACSTSDLIAATFEVVILLWRIFYDFTIADAQNFLMASFTRSDPKVAPAPRIAAFPNLRPNFDAHS
jgi:hypothetical protein